MRDNVGRFATDDRGDPSTVALPYSPREGEVFRCTPGRERTLEAAEGWTIEQTFPLGRFFQMHKVPAGERRVFIACTHRHRWHLTEV